MTLRVSMPGILQRPGILRRIAAGIASIALAGCAGILGVPGPVSTEDRLAQIPTQGAVVARPVTIYWSKEQIPFVEAETDADAAFALGVVHAHLRLGQLELLRRVSQGRLTEIAGPFDRIRQIEHALRILDLGRASHEIYARMPADSKAYLEAFVAGLNFYQRNVENLPHEYSVLGIAREPWEAHEILTLARLASVDVSWLTWLRLLPMRERNDWPRIWARMLEGGTASAPSFGLDRGSALQDFAEILAGTARTGSNSFAVGSGKTLSGAAIIASDPHLGINVPNIWLLAGVKSPSYHTAGFMIAGLPFVAVGRNADIAWGGTNLRSAASDLIDISDLPPQDIAVREAKTRIRWWFDDTLVLRDTPYGPIISDAEVIPKRPGEEFALKWIGHSPSDEFSAMLAVNRAENWDAFRAALEPFAISAQNFVYADRFGNVGQLTATHLPRRTVQPPADIIRPIADTAAWNTILTSRDLPQIYNPESGFVASANNKPAETPFPIGYFYSGDDRVLQLREVLASKDDFTVEDIKQLQSDTFMKSAARLRDALVARARTIADLPAAAIMTLAEVAAWNGRFDMDSRGAVAFQATVATLVPLLMDDVERAIIETGGSEYGVYADSIEQAPAGAIDVQVATALAAAQEALAAYPSWGDMHKLTLEHNFSMAPVIGGRYRFAELPWPGSTETLWRADHGLSAGELQTGFGAQARHISDMSDIDSNWFVLLGGNDGWINSDNFIDQVEMFRNSELIRIPLRPETVHGTFPYKTVFAP